MWIDIALGLAFFWYMTMPSDNTGWPYPTTEPEIREEIMRHEQWLKETEYDFKRIEVHKEVVAANAPLSSDARRVAGEYLERRDMRRNILNRIKNLKKLLGKYEEINAQYHSDSSPPAQHRKNRNATIERRGSG